MTNRDSDKLDKILDVQSRQAITLERLTVTVEDHVKRTNLLEERFAPVEKHVSMVNGAIKFIALASMAVTILEFIHRMFK
jgi:hypothetical protein